MYVYIWKDINHVPFYVGLSKKYHRTNPKNSGSRNKSCIEKLTAIGADNIIVELIQVPTLEAACQLEFDLVEKYGRLDLNTGTLTNRMEGGTARKTEISSDKLEKIKLTLADPNHPIRSPEARAKAIARLNAPDVKEKFLGDNNPAKAPEVRQKLKDIWDNEEYREAQRVRKLGKSIHSDKEKEKRKQALLDKNHPLNILEFHKTLNSDPDIKAKRVATLQSPEQRARQSAAMKANWIKRKALKSESQS